MSLSSSTSNMRMAVRSSSQIFGRALPVHALAQVACFVMPLEQDSRELVQGLCINVPLEFDDRIERNPVLAPTPCVELRVLRGAQADVAVPTDQLEQEPDLF